MNFKHIMMQDWKNRSIFNDYQNWCTGISHKSSLAERSMTRIKGMFWKVSLPSWRMKTTDNIIGYLNYPTEITAWNNIRCNLILYRSWRGCLTCRKNFGLDTSWTNSGEAYKKKQKKTPVLGSSTTVWVVSQLFWVRRWNRGRPPYGYRR